MTDRLGMEGKIHISPEKACCSYGTVFECDRYLVFFHSKLKIMHGIFKQYALFQKHII